MHLLIQVRITDQAPNQKREGEIWAWRGLGGPARRAPPTLLKEPAKLPTNRVFEPYSLCFPPSRLREHRQHTRQEPPICVPCAVRVRSTETSKHDCECRASRSGFNSAARVSVIESSHADASDF